MGLVDGEFRCPYGVPGDRLWVRERWGVTGAAHWPDLPHASDPADPRRVVYYAAAFDRSGSSIRWRSPIHMPRWASRLALRVEAVRVERLSAITEADAVAEGCGGVVVADPATDFGRVVTRAYRPALDVFRERWDAINAGRGYPWSADPWVWAVAFAVEPGGGAEGGAL